MACSDSETTMSEPDKIDGNKPHHVLLIEDDRPVRERLSAALMSHRDCTVAAAANLAEARTLLAEAVPDLIVSDLRLPDGLAIDFLAESRKQHPSIEILVISVLGDESTIIAAIAAGASGYLLKDALPEDIHSTAKEVLAGGSPISPSIARFIVRRMHQETTLPAASNVAAENTPPPLNAARTGDPLGNRQGADL